jgi:hypothetical protein
VTLKAARSVIWGGADQADVEPKVVVDMVDMLNDVGKEDVVTRGVGVGVVTEALTVFGGTVTVRISVTVLVAV